MEVTEEETGHKINSGKASEMLLFKVKGFKEVLGRGQLIYFEYSQNERISKNDE